LTASDVRSAAVETTAAAAAGSGWPLSDHATPGVGTPVTANCCARPAPAFSVRVDSSGRSGTSFGAAAPPTQNPRPRVKTTPQKETRRIFLRFFAICAIYGWLDSRVVSVLDSGLDANRTRDAVR